METSDIPRRTTPAQEVQNWLEKNSESLKLTPESDIILSARLALGCKIGDMTNGEIAAEIYTWAKAHVYLMPLSMRTYSPTNAAASWLAAKPVVSGDRSTLDAVLSHIKTKAEVTWDDGSASITASGLTVDLTSDQIEGKVGFDGVSFTKNKTAQMKVGWDGTMQFRTDSSGMTFVASVGPQNWSMTFTIGRQAPNLSDVTNIFEKGETALRGVVSNLNKVDLSDISKTKQQFSPYLDPIKGAVDAAGKIAALRPGDISFGVTLKGGYPGASGAAGVTATALFTIVF